MLNPSGLNLRQIYDLCEDAKAKKVSVLFRVSVNDPSRGYKFDLLGIPELTTPLTESEYLYYDEPSKYLRKQITQVKPLTNSKNYFHGVKLSVIAFSTDSEEAKSEFKSCAEFILKRGTFRRVQRGSSKKLQREAIITQAGRQDVLMYIDNPLNPDKVKNILNGSITLLEGYFK